MKTTSGGENTPFTVTLNEPTFSQQHIDSYYLYRLYDFDKNGDRAKFYVLQGDLSTNFALEAIEFRARR